MKKYWERPDFDNQEQVIKKEDWQREYPELNLPIISNTGLIIQQPHYGTVDGEIVEAGHHNTYLIIASFEEGQFITVPVMAETVLTGSTNTTVTSTANNTWNSANNTVQVIAGGGGGARGSSSSTSGGGGGAGAYTKTINTTMTGGSTSYYTRVGGPGQGSTTGTTTANMAGGDSWFTLTNPGTTFPAGSEIAAGAKAGSALSNTSVQGGAGGLLSAAYANAATGSVKTSGGIGGNAAAASSSGGGGGGAGGATANGITAALGPSSGGAGNGGTGNLGGAGGGAGNPGADGSPGTNITLSTSTIAANTGSGGGGGGGNSVNGPGGTGGLYGGGGGGASRTTGPGGSGRQGVVVLTWLMANSSAQAITLVDTVTKPNTRIQAIRSISNKHVKSYHLRLQILLHQLNKLVRSL